MGNRLTQIATRTGDDGTTGLGDNTRVTKSSGRPHAMGDVDELNSHIGLLLCETTLPQDVRDYILKQRMCRHFRKGGNPGNAALADALCAGGDAATWRSLIRKYQSDDTIGSVLLAEKPFDAPETSP